MRMTVAAAKKHVVGPAIRQHRKDAPTRQRDIDDLRSLGIGLKELPQLASKIHSLLGKKGWRIDRKHLKTLQPTTRIFDLTRVIADYAVAAPKTCANGHPQAYPGQTTCNLDGLPFQ